jgi:hypothetical protein
MEAGHRLPVFPPSLYKESEICGELICSYTPGIPADHRRVSYASQSVEQLMLS